MTYSRVLLTTIVYISYAIGHEFPWKDIFNHSSDLEKLKGITYAAGKVDIKVTNAVNVLRNV